MINLGRNTIIRNGQFRISYFCRRSANIITTSVELFSILIILVSAKIIAKVSYIGKLAAPPVSLNLKDQIRFSYFCRRSSSDHFDQIILNADYMCQRRRFLMFPYHCNPHSPVAKFLWIKFMLSIFVEVQLMTISAKSFFILNSGFREDVKSFL